MKVCSYRRTLSPKHNHRVLEKMPGTSALIGGYPTAASPMIIATILRVHRIAQQDYETLPLSPFIQGCYTSFQDKLSDFSTTFKPFLS